MRLPTENTNSGRQPLNGLHRLSYCSVQDPMAAVSPAHLFGVDRRVERHTG